MAVTSPARGASTSPTTAVSSPRRTRRPRPTSSPPRPPDCAGSPRPTRSPCPTCSPFATRRRTCSCSGGSTKLAAPHRPTGERGSGASSPPSTAPARRLRARGPADDGEPRAAQRAVCDVGRVLRHAAAPAARPAGRDGARAPGTAIGGAGSARRPARPLRRGRRAAGPAARRPVGRQPAGRPSTARSWLIDPAAHGGHREFDLAMMRLFGGFGEDCFAAYDEVAPLAAGWQRAGRAAPDRTARRARDQVRWRLCRSRHPSDRGLRLIGSAGARERHVGPLRAAGDLLPEPVRGDEGLGL